ncbi:unnamed protein product [Timema podura]|uniref:Uncharacterized protein n=1 Tax=Timema podura TaxID=61482 RepID=A0ABN7NUQ6_TIMPD|nr:unnamed protein product [Timema podura]
MPRIELMATLLRLSMSPSTVLVYGKRTNTGLKQVAVQNLSKKIPTQALVSTRKLLWLNNYALGAVKLPGGYTPNQSKLAGQLCIVISDQPLFLKELDIVVSTADDSSIADKLIEEHISVLVAEEDASVEILQKAISVSKSHSQSSVVIVGQDTDMLILLVGLPESEKLSMFFQKPSGNSTSTTLYDIFKLRNTSFKLITRLKNGLDKRISTQLNGFDNKLYSVHSTKPAAPEEVINLVSCKEMCVVCGGSCTNVIMVEEEDVDEDVIGVRGAHS